MTAMFVNLLVTDLERAEQGPEAFMNQQAWGRWPC